MSIALRPATISDLAALSALCLRSKGHWGYDQAFLDACRAELTITPDDLAQNQTIVALWDDTIAGTVQLATHDAIAEIHMLFVDPPFMARGIGTALFQWCVDTARDAGIKSLRADADPEATAFYERMGATQAGYAPSGSIPGRKLPIMSYQIR